MCQRFITRQFAVPSANGCGRSSARSRQCLEAQLGEQSCGTRIPGVRNDEDVGAVMKRAEARCFFVLGVAHRSCLAKSGRVRGNNEEPALDGFQNRFFVSIDDLFAGFSDADRFQRAVHLRYVLFLDARSSHKIPQ